MELIQADQVSFNELYEVPFDVVIGVAGYESRCPYMFEKMVLVDEIKVALAFRERSADLHRPENNQKLRDMGFNFVEASGNSLVDVGSILESCGSDQKDSLNILVDYSCMTKLWYASFVNYFIQNELPQKKISVYFAYTSSTFSEPKKPVNLKMAEPLGNGPHGIIKGKPVALIIGLGYEKNKAEFLYKTLEPEQTYVFYADPTDDHRFVEKVYINNFRLIDHLHKDQVINFPIRDLKKIDSLLTTLCLDLRLNYKVILAPLGPKPFALCCMLLAARYPDIEVWRVSAGKSENVYDREPFGEPLVYRVDFGLDEDY
jgi:hypothetical protein